MHFQPPRPRSDDERVLPLINVVFLLLIFFMLAGQLTAPEPFPVEPPQSASEEPAEAREAVVSVAADGRLALDGEAMDEAALAATLGARIASGTAPDLRVRADGRAEAVRVVAVMELLKAAGVERLELLTVPEER